VDALCETAREQGCTVDELCLTIGNEFPDADFTQTARQVGRAARTPPKSRATSLIFDTPAQNWHR
jgi:hypothetical protein